MARALFIGLGGSGVTTVGHIKAKFLSQFKLEKAKLAEKCRFLFIDTTSNDLEKVAKAHESLCGSFWIEQAEIISLGNIIPYQIYAKITARSGRSPDEKRLLEWIDDRGALSLENSPMNLGAGANRQQGRIALWAKWRSIENAVTTAISSLGGVQGQDGNQQDPLTVYLVSGTCGGTGSSMFLDVANLVHRAYRKTFAGINGEPDLVGVLFMPHEYLRIYESGNASKNTLLRYESNGEAFFLEMEALLEDRWNGNGKAFDELAVRPLAIGTASVFSVFSYAFCMDSVSDLGGTLTQEQMYSSAARALYHWVEGRIGGQVNLATVNTLKGNYAHDRSAGGLVPAFAALGYRELRYPEEYMERYFEKRFLVELLEGVAGQELHRIWPNPSQANDYVTTAWKNLIGAYVQAKHAQPSLPNLERDATELAREGLALPLGSFYNEKGKPDKTKIMNADNLNQLGVMASVLLEQKKSQLEAAWKKGSLSYQDLLQKIEDGLGAEVEQIILRWGLRAAKEAVGRWDILCQEAIATPPPDNDLNERIANVSNELKTLESDIQASQTNCTEKGRPEELQKLSDLYRQKIEKVLEEWVLKRQKDILNSLSEGQSGILDAWSARLEDMIKVWSARCEEAKNSYAALAKAFMETEQDATTVFLPRVASFVTGGSWSSEHLFSTLYESHLLPQESAAGAAKAPKRFGASQGLDPSHEGLHKALEEMLASKEATGAEGGYQKDKTIYFFRKALPLRGTVAEWEPQRLAGELEGVGARYIARKAEVDRTIGEEKNRTLQERFSALAPVDQAAIAKKFSPDHVHFFCPMQNHEAQIHRVYCGASATYDLATKLGFNDKDKSMVWVASESPNVLTLVKSGFRYALDMYSERADYQKAFEDSLRDSSSSGVAFVPHIDARFTRDGVRNVIRLMAAKALTEEEKLKLYSLAILWRSLGKQAGWRSLLERILNLDPRFVDDQKREASPLLIESPPSGGDKHVYVCTGVEAVEGRSAFLRKNFRDYGVGRNYQEAFERIKASPHAWAVLSSFTDLVLSQGDAGWVPVIESERETLVTKLRDKNIDDLIRDFYAKLSNALISEVDALKNTLGQRLMSTAPAAGPAPVVATVVDPNMD